MDSCTRQDCEQVIVICLEHLMYLRDLVDGEVDANHLAKALLQLRLYEVDFNRAVYGPDMEE